MAGHRTFSGTILEFLAISLGTGGMSAYAALPECDCIIWLSLFKYTVHYRTMD